MPPVKEQPKLFGVTRGSWQELIAPPDRVFRKSERIKMVTGLRALVDTMPEGDRRTALTKELEGNVDSFFTEAGKVTDKFDKTIGAVMMEAVGDRYTVVNSGGRRLVVFGVNDDAGSFVINAVTDVALSRVPEPLEKLRVKNNAATVEFGKNIPLDVVEDIMKNGTPIKGTLNVEDAPPKKATEERDVLKDMLDNTTAKTAQEQKVLIGRLKVIAASAPVSGDRNALSDALSADPASYFTADGKFKDTFKSTVADVMAKGLGKQMVFGKDTNGDNYIVFGDQGGLGGMRANAILPVSAAGGADPFSQLKIRRNAGKTYNSQQTTATVDAIIAGGTIPLDPTTIKAPPTRRANPPPVPPKDEDAPPVPPKRRQTPAADKVTLMNDAERDAVIDRMLAFEVKSEAVKPMIRTAELDVKKALAVSRLKKMAAAMPDGDKKKTLMEALDDTNAVFDDTGRLVPAVKTAFKDAFTEDMGAYAATVEKEGKKYIVFGNLNSAEKEGVTTYSGLEVKAMLAEEDLGSPDAMEKMRRPLAKTEIPFAGGKTYDDSNWVAKPELMSTQAAVAVAEVKESGAPVISPAADAGPPSLDPAPIGVVGGNTRTLGPRKPWYERLMNKNSLLGLVLGTIAGGIFGGGPIAMIIGALLGGIGMNFLAGDNPFSDKETMTLAPNDTRVQVRDREGNSPVMEMTMAAGEPGKQMSIRGKASADGTKFEITESVIISKVPGTPVNRQRYNPPLTVSIDGNGFVDTTKIYEAMGQKVPLALRKAAATKPSAGGTAVDPAKAAGFEQGGYDKGDKRYILYTKDNMEYELVGTVDMDKRKFVPEKMVIKAKDGPTKEFTESLPEFDVDDKGKVNLADKAVQDKFTTAATAIAKGMPVAPSPDIAVYPNNPYADLDKLNAYLKATGRDKEPTTFRGTAGPVDPTVERAR